MSLSVGKKIALGFAVAMVVLLVIGTMLHWNLTQVEEDTGWVTHTLQVQHDLSGLMLNLVSTESNSRSYLLSPDNSFKGMETDARIEAQKSVRNLRELTIDNPHETDRFDRLDPLVARRFDALEQLVALRDQKVPISDPRMVSLLNEGRNLMDQSSQIIQDASAE